MPDKKSAAAEEASPSSCECMGEEKLKAGEQRYRALIEATSQLVWWMDPDGRILDVHPGFAKFTGRPREALVGKDWADLVQPADMAKVAGRWRAARSRAESFRCETRLRDKYGKARWFDLRVAPVTGADGGIREWVAGGTDVHERKQAALGIAESEIRYRTLFATAQDGILLGDEETILEVNPKATQIFGLPAAEMTGRPHAMLHAPVQPDGSVSAERARALIEAAIAGVPQDVEWVCRRGDGQVIDCEVSLSGLTLGERRLCMAIVRDVTEKKRMLAEARKLSRVLEVTPDAIIITDPEQCIEYANPAAESITGYSPEELIGRSPRMLGAGGQEELVQRMRDSMARGETFHDIIVNRRKDGELYYAETSIVPVTDERGRLSHYVGISRDITKELDTEEQLAYLVHHDPVTELPNRALLKDRLNQSLAQAALRGTGVLVIHLDLDRFGLANELAGRVGGDALLMEVGARLRAAVNGHGTVARTVGDEFLIELQMAADPDEPIRWVERLQQAIAPPIDLAGHQYFPSATMGLAASPEDSAKADELLKLAETALRQAMEDAPLAYCFWSPRMSEKAQRMVLADGELRRALADGRFELHYQPRVDIMTGRITSAEGLLRWNHPERGMVSPAEFIPLLEQTGLIREVGEWVIRQACRQARQWARLGDRLGRLSINVSARQLAAGDLEEVVARCLEESGCPGERLELEITETAVMANPEQAARTLKAIQAMGITIALDDFGQGYSSLGYIKQFTPNVLKIDRAFVREVTSSPDDAAIARTIIAMGHSLHMKVVAEGVETESQLAFMRRAGCDQIQGYLFSRPLPASEFRTLLETGRRLSVPEGPAGYRRTILFLDDEPNVCTALKRVVRNDAYEVLTASSPEAAFELLARTPDLGVVVSDQRMPGMTGTEFLARVRELYPSVVRMVLSGYADVETLTDAVNRGAVYKFLTKPWDNEAFREEVRRAFAAYESKRKFAAGEFAA